MKISIITLGSRGDVQPFLALAMGLRRAGHQVCLATHAVFRDFVSSKGITFRALPPDDLKELMASSTGQAFASGRPLISLIGGYRFFRSFAPMVEQVFESAYGASRDADLIITSMIAPGQLIAERLGIPCVLSGLWPIGRTSVYRHPAVPFRTGPLNSLTHPVIERIMYYMFLGPTRRWRQKNGMKRLRFTDNLYGYIRKNSYPWVYAFSEHVLPRPSDWPETHHITGYWFMEDDPGYVPPDGLDDFIKSGEAPLYIGLGSLVLEDAGELTRIITSAVTEAGVRAVLCSGWGGIRAPGKNRDLFHVQEADHGWLLPRCRAALHHGGAGTTASVIRSGIPALIIPFSADQFFWGEQVERLGTGPAPLPRTRVTIKRLAERIRALAGTNGYAKKAKDLGGRVRSENGVLRTVDLIQRLFGRGA